MKFKDRFKEVRLDKGYTHKEIAAALGIYADNISNWERGVKKPSLDSFFAVCKLFTVSADYLLGLKDEP